MPEGLDFEDEEKSGDIGEVFYFLLLYDYDRNEICSVGVGKVLNASQ